MNGSTIKVGTFPDYGRLRPPAGTAPRVRTRVVERRESAPFSPIAALTSMLAALVYAVISLVLAVSVVCAAVLVLPWLLLAPALVVGLVILIAGFLLGGLGLL